MMHLRTYWLKYRRWLVFFVIGVALFIAGTRTFGSATDIRGWFWNAYQPENSNDKIGLGWTSMSCLNDFDNDGLLEYECSNGALNTVYGVSISLGADAALNGTNDYVQGCAWSSAYGWVCFNGGAGQQCSAGNACTDLSASGVSIVAGKYCSNNPMTSCTSSADCDDNPCNAYFYHLQSPAYPSWPTGANEHATVLSLYDDADEVKGYVRFPFTDDASVVFDPELSPPAQDTLFGCFGCRNVCSNNASLACVSDDDCPGSGTCGVCDACLNTSTGPAGDENPNPNLLCWNCTECGIGEPGGSCNLNRDKNSCVASSCSACTEYPGVIVNQASQGSYEMCGWGWHAYDDDATVDSPSIMTVNSDLTNNNDLDPGRKNALAFGSDHLPAIAYFTLTNNDNAIHFVKCGDPSCIIQEDVTVDEWFVNDGGFIEKSILLGTPGFALDDFDRPVFSWSYCFNNEFGCDSNRTYMQFAKCSDVICSGMTERELVRNADAQEVSDKHIVINTIGSGNPVISGYKGPTGSQNKIWIFVCEDSDCSGVINNHTYVIPEKSATDWKAPLVIPSDNKPIIAFAQETSLDILRCDDTECTDATRHLVTSGTSGIVLEDHSMVLGTDGFPVIAYAISSPANEVHVVKCGDADCASIQDTLIDERAASAVDVTINQDGYPVVVYNETESSTNGLNTRVVLCNDEACTQFSSPAVITTGLYTGGYSVQTGIDDSPTFTFSTLYSEALNSENSLNFLRCSNKRCSSSLEKGLGWLAFNPSQIGDIAYVEAQQGSIFSGRNIYSPVGPPVNKYNAAYLIEAGGTIENWFSRNRLRYPGVSERDQTQIPEFPDVDTRGVYSNVLGTLDVTGIVTNVAAGARTGMTVNAANPTGTNKYGASIQYIASDSFLDASPPWGPVLNDRVFYSDQNLTIDTTNIIDCGDGTLRGAGIVVVDGDLHVNAEVRLLYGSNSSNCTSMSSLRDIPSLVWIVRGDIIFESGSQSAQQVSGIFVALGNQASTGCPTLDVASNHCGRVSTGRSDQRLTIAGGMIARQYNFERTTSALSCGTSTSCPAEAFVADGRLQANPPSGLSRFADSVPRFTFGF